MTGAEAEFVDEARVMHLATVLPDGRAHVIPVCHVLDMDRLVIASAYDQKVANVRDNPFVSACVDVYSEDWDEGLHQVIVFGSAYLIESGPEFVRDLNLLYEKFPQYERVAPIEEGSSVIIEIRIDRVSSSGV
jgi:nitroimidazol reductase NimA-like FMN-containing flavoprotein (pyridoxamine 5'-phosphate oxidase superfamily)